MNKVFIITRREYATDVVTNYGLVFYTSRAQAEKARDLAVLAHEAYVEGLIEMYPDEDPPRVAFEIVQLNAG